MVKAVASYGLLYDVFNKMSESFLILWDFYALAESGTYLKRKRTRRLLPEHHVGVQMELDVCGLSKGNLSIILRNLMPAGCSPERVDRGESKS